MAKERTASNRTRLRRISRRSFIKLAAASLLAGCTPAQKPTATPDPSTPEAQTQVSEVKEPTSTSTLLPTATPSPAPAATSTATPALTPTATPASIKVEDPTSAPTATLLPTATPSPAPTATPLSTAGVRRPEIIKMYPDVPSKVVHARHAGVWEGKNLVPGALRQMLDASITELTGLNDVRGAWSSLFAPDERIAIKVNTIRSSSFWTHVPLVTAVAESLQEAGIPAEQIVIFDRVTRELENAGYPVNEDGPGVRCYGTGIDHAAGWTLLEQEVRLSNVLLNCDALINIPTLKQHDLSGISFAMKNHYGTFDRPQAFHGPIQRALPALNALPPIKDRTRLIIGDVLTICKRGWRSAFPGDSILMSYDPVAHDTIGLQLYEEAMAAEGRSTTAENNSAVPCLEGGAELGLGTNDPEHIELVEVGL